MDTHASPCQELDLHRLELRFASARLHQPHAVERLAHSIERCGQIIACIVVPAPGGEHLVLVDGYRRIAALRRLGRDTAKVECWACDLAQGLIHVLCRTQGRAFAAIEGVLPARLHSVGECRIFSSVRVFRGQVMGCGTTEHVGVKRAG